MEPSETTQECKGCFKIRNLLISYTVVVDYSERLCGSCRQCKKLLTN